MENHLLFDEPIGSMLTAEVHVFSDSGFCTSRGVLDPTSASGYGEKTTENVMKSHNCTNRNDIASQSVDVDWHVCLGDMSVQVLQRLQVFTSETEHEPGSFPDRVLSARTFKYITYRKCQKSAKQTSP